MPLFSFKKKEAPTQQLPVEQVMSLMKQGYTNDQIAQALQAQGFTPQQVYDAISQAQMRAVPDQQLPPPTVSEMPLPPQLPSVSPMQPQLPAEELVESIVEEKWHELMREFGKWTDWKEKTDSRIDKLEQGLADLKSDLDGLHKAIVAKIGEYDKNLLDVGTEIKAMEKVFQKIIPELTTSVSELSRITKAVRKKEE